MGVGLHVLRGHLGFRLGSQFAEQLADLGVVRAQDGEPKALAGGGAGLFQLDHDAGRCPPRPGLHVVAPAIRSGEHEGRRRRAQLRQTGQLGDPAVGAAVAQRGVAQVDPHVACATVLADVARHIGTLRAAGAFVRQVRPLCLPVGYATMRVAPTCHRDLQCRRYHVSVPTAQQAPC